MTQTPTAEQAALRLRDHLVAQGIAHPTVGTGNVGTTEQPEQGLHVYLAASTLKRINAPQEFDGYTVKWHPGARAHAVAGSWD